jgi:hypothetical protein
MKSVTLASLFVLATTMPLLHPPAAAYAVSVKIEPQGPGGSAYELLDAQRRVTRPHSCSVDVTDLTNKVTLKGPRIAVQPGSRSSKTVEISGYTIDVSVFLSADARRATSDVVLRRNGEIVTRQQSDTRLER